jgi:glycosyltransferase involved in cell wall biosynthesis
VIFNAGRRAKGKRQDLAEAGVEAARRIVQDQDLRLFVIDGFQPPELVPCLLNAADCIVLTSDFEGSPNIVKEALACCLPVVSVDAGDVKERISAVHPSLIVGREPRQIGAGIAEILRLGVRSNGYDVIRRELSEGAMVKVLLDFYRQFMGS